MKSFRLKCKHKNGHCIIDSLSEESSLGELLKVISSMAGMEDSVCALKTGYPPQYVDTSDTSQTLKTVNIRSGDTVIAEIQNKNPEPTKEDQSIVSNTKSDIPASLLTDNSSGSTEGHLLIRHTVPANDSCLFTSIDFCLNKGILNLSCAPEMRRLIAHCVLDNPSKYNAVFLGMAPESYCAKIKEDQWGGGIELDILSRYYQLEIDVVDTQSIRIDRFGEDENYLERILLIYDGIHYDPLALENFDFRGEGRIQTRFLRNDDTVLLLALELAKEAKSSRQFTDVTKFTVKCMDCNIYLSGEKEAQEHAMLTCHTNFQEV